MTIENFVIDTIINTIASVWLENKLSVPQSHSLRSWKTVHFSEQIVFAVKISEFIIHQIFSLERDWCKHVT